MTPNPPNLVGRCAEVDPELFFPEKGGTSRPAKSVCAVCEVEVECLAWALATDQRFGVWGGTTERERRKLNQETEVVT